MIILMWYSFMIFPHARLKKTIPIKGTADNNGFVLWARIKVMKELNRRKKAIKSKTSNSYLLNWTIVIFDEWIRNTKIKANSNPMAYELAPNTTSMTLGINQIVRVESISLILNLFCRFMAQLLFNTQSLHA